MEQYNTLADYESGVIVWTNEGVISLWFLRLYVPDQARITV